MAREDPAGMGVFSLAGRRLEVSSRAPGSKTGWRIDIGPDDWESAAPIAVTAIGHPVGTCFRFELESPWAFSLDRPAQQAASDRKSGVEGKRVSVRVGLGGRLYIKKKK